MVLVMSRLLTHHTPGRLTLLCGLFAALFAALGALAFITATEARRHAGHLAGVDLPATAAIARLQTAAVDLVFIHAEASVVDRC